MDQNLLTWCVLAPASFAVLGSLCGWWIDRKLVSGAECQSDGQTLSLSSGMIACGWWAAICAGFYSSDSVALWPEEAWARALWPVLAAAIFVSPHFKPSGIPSDAVFSPNHSVRSDTPGLWVLVSLIAVATASLVMPTGEGWDDMIPLHQPWIAAVALATICNSFALHRMSQRGANRWLPLVMLAGLASSTLICASAYGALAQACFAAIVATAVIAIFSAGGKLLAPAALILPCSLFATTMIAAGRFYSYAEIAPGDYAIAMFAPAIIALVDRIFTNKSPALRISIAATTAIAIVGYIAYRFLLS